MLSTLVARYSARGNTPALANTWSTRPYNSIVFLNSITRSAHTVTSVRTYVNVVVGVENGSSGGGLMSPFTTDAPSERNRFTLARPIPDEPPTSIVSWGTAKMQN